MPKSTQFPDPKTYHEFEDMEISPRVKSYMINKYPALSDRYKAYADNERKYVDRQEKYRKRQHMAADMAGALDQYFNAEAIGRGVYKPNKDFYEGLKDDADEEYANRKEKRKEVLSDLMQRTSLDDHQRKRERQDKDWAFEDKSRTWKEEDRQYEDQDKFADTDSSQAVREFMRAQFPEIVEKMDPKLFERLDANKLFKIMKESSGGKLDDKMLRHQLQMQLLQQGQANRLGIMDQQFKNQSDLLDQRYKYDIDKLDRSAKEKANKPEKITADQRKVATFAERIEQAESVFNHLSESGFDRGSIANEIGARLPGFFQSSNVKSQEQAERNFINAVLRRESGAAISPTEFDSAEKQYFPRAGDSAEVLAQKKRNREIVLQGLKAEAGDTAVSDIQKRLGPAPKKQRQFPLKVKRQVNGRVETTTVENEQELLEASEEGFKP